jgi:hypothetical protein
VKKSLHQLRAGICSGRFLKRALFGGRQNAADV